MTLTGLTLRRGLILALLGSLASAQSSAPALQNATLRPTFGGVLLEGRFSARGGAVLSGVWSDAGRANLMRCAPSCAVVDELPLSSPLTVSQRSVYRVVLGGQFKPRQNVQLLLRFSKGDPVTMTVMVSGK